MVDQRQLPQPLDDSAAELLCKKWLTFLGYRVHRAGKVAVRIPAAPLPTEGTDWKLIDAAIAKAPLELADALCRLVTLAERGRVQVRTKQHDLHGAADLEAITTDGEHPDRELWYLQLTTPEGRSARRRKLEAVTWPSFARVSLVTHEPQGRGKHAWRVEDFGYRDEAAQVRDWLPPVAIAFDKRAVEEHARRQEEAPAPPRPPAPRRPRKLDCGHPASELEGGVTGAAHCGACRRERAESPLFWRGA